MLETGVAGQELEVRVAQLERYVEFAEARLLERGWPGLRARSTACAESCATTCTTSRSGRRPGSAPGNPQGSDRAGSAITTAGRGLSCGRNLTNLTWPARLLLDVRSGR
jgi:hypothetical protein